VSALQSGKMTVQTTRFFVSAVGAAIFSYKQRPTQDDYYNVALAITNK